MEQIIPTPNVKRILLEWKIHKETTIGCSYSLE